MKTSITAILVILCYAPAVALAQPRRLSITEAVDAALAQSDEVAIANEAVNAARARVDGARAQRLPRLRAEGAVNVWNEALTFSFGDTAVPGMSAPTIREQITTTASISLSQPVSGLLVIDKLIGLEQHGVGVARAELDATRIEVASGVAESYLRLLQAKASRDVAQKSLAQLEAQLARARQFEAAGSLGKVDTLRIETARDTAKQAALRADAGVLVGERALVLALGLGATTRLDTFDDMPQALPALPWTEQAAIELALRNRPELRGAAERVAQARSAREVARTAYYPNINAVAVYQNNQGVGTIQPENAAFVGLNLQWDVWDWGKTRASVREADHHRRQAEIVRDRLAEQLVFDVRRRWVEADTARQGLAIAATGVAAAEEAYRIQNARFEQGAATTTDLLESETEVARARLGVIVARYDYLVSLVSLAQGVGQTWRALK